MMTPITPNCTAITGPTFRHKLIIHTRCKASPSIGLETDHFQYFHYRIGSPFRTRFPTTSQPTTSTHRSLAPSRLHFAHTHTPSPSSFVTHSFTLTSQWTPPIALQVRRQLAHKPSIPTPHVTPYPSPLDTFFSEAVKTLRTAC